MATNQNRFSGNPYHWTCYFGLGRHLFVIPALLH